jgi:hypothetical protein
LTGGREGGKEGWWDAAAAAAVVTGDGESKGRSVSGLFWREVSREGGREGGRKEGREGGWVTPKRTASFLLLCSLGLR